MTISATVRTDFDDEMMNQIAEFIAGCTDMHVLRQINQQILMPQIKKVYATKSEMFTRHAIDNGDLMIAKNPEGDYHVMMVDAVELGNHVVKAWWYGTREDGYSNLKLRTDDVYEVIRINDIVAETKDEFREKVQALIAERVAPCIETVEQIIDMDYLLDDLCSVWEW
jgi:hypothetical protein